MYNMLLNAVNDRQNYNGKKWTFQVKQLLDSNGLSYIWENQNPTPLQINSIINRIKDTYYQQRYSKINTWPRLQTYALFKHTFEFEN